MASPREIAKCYLCGIDLREDVPPRAVNKWTRDHIPPEGFYPVPPPGNLLKVNCCDPCNNGYSHEDDFMRMIASCQMIETSESAAWIWREKVNPILDGRLDPERLKIVQTMRDSWVITPFGLRHIISYDQNRAKDWFIRVGKGLCRKREIDKDFSHSEFRATLLPLFDMPAVIAGMDPAQEFAAIGNDVFRCWYQPITMPPLIGRWIVVLYGGFAFLVAHGPAAPSTNSSSL